MVVLILASVAILAVLSVTNVVTYHISEVRESLETRGAITASEGLTITTADKSLKIDWGFMAPGGNATQDVQARNDLHDPVTLYLTTGDWTPPEAADVLKLSWNYTGAPVKPGETVPLALTVTAAEDVGDLTNFAFNITITGVT